MPESGFDTRIGRNSEYGILSRIRLGRAALTVAAVEVSASVGSLYLEEPWPVVISSLLLAALAADVGHDLYNNRNHPKENLVGPTRWLAQDDPEK